MESQIIDSIGKLSVEVVAIIALAGSLYFQAKASRSQAKEMKNLAQAIYKQNTISLENNTQIEKSVKNVVNLVEMHQEWGERALNKILNKAV